MVILGLWLCEFFLKNELYFMLSIKEEKVSTWLCIKLNVILDWPLRH